MAESSSYRKPQLFHAYWKVHEKYMDDFVEEGLVIIDPPEVDEEGNEKDSDYKFKLKEDVEEETGELSDTGLLHIERWKIKIRGDLTMTVDKSFSTFIEGGQQYIQTDSYSYKLSRNGVGLIFRYDSPDADINDDAPEHHKHHHKHIFDPEDNEVDIQLIQDGNWPTLGQAIREAEDHIQA